MRGCRMKMQVRKKPTLNLYLAKFDAGDVVHIHYLPSSPLPHPRFQGLTGKVVGKRGSSYGVAVNDGNKPKMLFLRPEHLQRSKVSLKSKDASHFEDLKKG